MDQPRLNFLNLFFNFKKNFYKNSFLLKSFEADFSNIHSLKNHNNNLYLKKKRLNKKPNPFYKIKLKKVFNNKFINNILFF